MQAVSIKDADLTRLFVQNIEIASRIHSESADCAEDLWTWSILDTELHRDTSPPTLIVGPGAAAGIGHVLSQTDRIHAIARRVIRAAARRKQRGRTEEEPNACHRTHSLVRCASVFS
jgi:hypothetical protein